MSRTTHYNIVIVGGGIVGLITSIFTLRHELMIAVLSDKRLI